VGLGPVGCGNGQLHPPGCGIRPLVLQQRDHPRGPARSDGAGALSGALDGAIALGLAYTEAGERVEEIEAVRRELRCAAAESTVAAIRPRASLSFMSMPLIAETLFKGNSNQIQRISGLYLHSATIPCTPAGDKLFIIFAFNRNCEVILKLVIAAL